jgi:2-C-methyl-D-erythritol 2,4-cyclodiphosphate synthase
MTVRTGIGFDAHRFEPGRALMLGCIEIPFDRGLGGHSDGDVVAHAMCDALLGAAGFGDVGKAFPPEPRWAGAAGDVLLREVAARLTGFSIEWIDCTVICEQPRLSGHAGKMASAVASALGVPPERVSLKATTTDGMGFTGRGEGIAAMAVATLAGSPPSNGRPV